MNTNLLGIILCGGESKRMGQDKSLMLSGPYSWAEQAQHKLASVGLKTAFSINTSQIESYSKNRESDSIIIDSLPIPGPLNGLLSAHIQNPETDLLIIACDLTEIDTDLIKTLCNTYQEKPNFDFYYFEIRGRKEPLCAIYRYQALQSLYNNWKSERLNGYSLQQILVKERSYILACKDEKSFLNVNTMDIWKKHNAAHGKKNADERSI